MFYHILEEDNILTIFKSNYMLFLQPIIKKYYLYTIESVQFLFSIDSYYIQILAFYCLLFSLALFITKQNLIIFTDSAALDGSSNSNLDFYYYQSNNILALLLIPCIYMLKLLFFCIITYYYKIFNIFLTIISSSNY